MRKNDIVRLSIEEINNLGCGVGHLKNADGSRGQVVFVRDAVSGDELDARIIKVTKNYLVGKIEKIITPSALRCKPDCEAAGCGGCVYRHIGYEHECEMKRAHVQSAFHKVGLGDVKVLPVRHTPS
jgi:23S rRNA (uracil1939-C5)-methyltransferase